MDIASIIASALSSNLYLNGLAYLDYLDLPQNLKPFNGHFFNEKTAHGNKNFVLSNPSQIESNGKVQLSRDVMNGEVPIESIEQEMLTNPSSSFKINFSTWQPLANCEVLIDDVQKKQFMQGFEETREFYSACERVADLSAIEQPADFKLFESLI